LRIPDDVSLAGVGETEPMLHEPALTTVREFPEQVGRELARLLLNRLAEPDVAPQQVVVATELVLRESCGRPPLSGKSPLSAELDSNEDATPDA
jgi:DNA-binding LacI/PurR family transcriptional regulator